MPPLIIHAKIYCKKVSCYAKSGGVLSSRNSHEIRYCLCASATALITRDGDGRRPILRTCPTALPTAACIVSHTSTLVGSRFTRDIAQAVLAAGQGSGRCRARRRTGAAGGASVKVRPARCAAPSGLGDQFRSSGNARASAAKARPCARRSRLTETSSDQRRQPLPAWRKQQAEDMPLGKDVKAVRLRSPHPIVPRPGRSPQFGWRLVLPSAI